MRCFIEGFSGGSGGKLYAAIGVKYPEGSTLTCTNGAKTLKAETTTGQWVFTIPAAGTWTVTATDGTNTKSQTVSITAEGQFESVTLNYELVLLSENGLAEGYSAGEYAILPAIDVSSYDVVEFSAARTFAAAQGYGVNVGLSATESADLAASVFVGDVTMKTYSLDISSLTGLYYFASEYAIGMTEKNTIETGNAGATVEIYSITFR